METVGVRESSLVLQYIITVAFECRCLRPGFVARSPVGLARYASGAAPCRMRRIDPLGVSTIFELKYSGNSRADQKARSCQVDCAVESMVPSPPRSSSINTSGDTVPWIVTVAMSWFPVKRNFPDTGSKSTLVG